MSVRILIGDCRERLAELPDASVDSVVCDPPYHLTSIVKRFGSENAAPAKSNGATGVYGRASKGFMGQTWDGGDVAFQPETWAEVLRVLKPGGHLIAFSGTRTYHRMVCAIEDAGFEIRDQLAWVYGSGFPKSLDVSKQIDKAAGAEREVRGRRTDGRYAHAMPVSGRSSGIMGEVVERLPPAITAPATDAAREWQGWGTALKPSWEPICLARKPLQGTVAQNCLTHGTGALNIDGCRIEAQGRPLIESRSEASVSTFGDGLNGSRHAGQTDVGRWPANLCHDGSEEVLAGFPEEAGSNSTDRGKGRNNGIFGNLPTGTSHDTRANGGSAARFFYCAKATTDERGEGNTHPTVKPIALMRWLVRLVTPKGGTVLDPFMGSGSTALACDAEQFDFIGCELSEAYAAIAEKRIRDAAGMFANVEVSEPKAKAA